MNIFNKVTIQSLKKNKTRTIVTIIGIMLSAAMICAVTTFVSSIQNYLLNYAIYNDGDWHGQTDSVDYETYTQISNHNDVSTVAYSHNVGYAKINSTNEFKPYLYVIGGDKDNFFDMLPVHLVSGEYPQNTSEIIVPSHVMSNGGLEYKVGDTLTLELGERMLDGYSMTQKNPCYEWDVELREDVFNGEVLEVKETRTYTIVGIYERPSFEGIEAPGYTAITVADEDFASAARFDVYFKMSNPSQVYSFMEEMTLNGTQNSDVLMFMGVSEFSSFTAILVGLSAIVIALIMFGSVSLIYNAFAISVSERTKQFGLLSSVGATKKQLKKMVLFEALSVSAVGIPLGIGVGIAGIGTTLLIIGDKFSSMFASYDAPMRICVSWQSIVIAAIVALITVLISAWIPSKRATKVSAVEAIRQNTDIKIKNTKAKTSKLTYKLFGLPGVLASKHYKRNKKKYRTTVISLFMSIVLFVSASSFADYLMESVTGGFGSNDYDIWYITHEDDMGDKSPQDVLDLLTSDENVTDGAYMHSIVFHQGQISAEYLTEEYMQWNGVSSETGTYSIGGIYHFVDDTAFNKLLKENRLDREGFYDPQKPVGLAIDRLTYFDGKLEKFITLDTLNGDSCEMSCNIIKDEEYYMGEMINEQGEMIVIYRNPNSSDDFDNTIEVPYEDAVETLTITTVKTLNEFPYYVDMDSGLELKVIYPISMMKYVLPENLQQDLSYRFYLQSDNHTASYENLKSVLEENNLIPDNLTDYTQNEEEMRNIVNIIQVFSYGFIVLISLIAAANVFNTISTNIGLRRREFAMLKSVGMTQKGFNKMMNFECLLYGSKALILGLPVSAGITYLIYKTISEGFETTYHLPLAAIGIAVLSVFAVVFVTMLYSMSKIKKENPIDALKNENL